MVGLSYEPSVQAVLSSVLPPSTPLTGDSVHLRRPVSWPLLARATGLGEIQGGEIVLVPAGRAEKILPYAAALDRAGVAALVVAGEPSSQLTDPDQATSLPIAVVPAGVDLRRLQSDMEQFIMRRRRELFDLSQRLHRALVEGAIGGMSAQDLLVEAHRLSGKPVVLDRDGDVLSADDTLAFDNRELLLEARIAMHGPVAGCVPLAGPPPSLAAPVLKGSERRGIALLLDVDEHALDEAEAILMTLGSACAIALAREPAVGVATLDELLSGRGTRSEGVQLREEQADWVALAVRDLGVPAARLERALSLELDARDSRFVLGREDDMLVAVVRAPTAPAWGPVLRAIQLRLGSSDAMAGVGRAHVGPTGARRAVDEAIEALERGAPGSLTPYEAVELQVLLGRLPEWQSFVRARLGPLLESAANRRDLLQTLEVYLGTGQNATEAARRLQVHRNTLLYRLGRIRTLLDVDLEDPEEVFALALAQRILRTHGGELSAGADTG